VRLKGTLISVIVSGTAKESALMKVGPECKTVIGKEMKIIFRPNQKCFILMDLRSLGSIVSAALKIREISN
jgi:hypothetical protein